MAHIVQIPEGCRPAGYRWLLEHVQMTCIPHWMECFVQDRGTRKTECNDGQCQEFYPPSYWPGDRPGDHLEFALKYEGYHFQILSRALAWWDDQEFAAWIQEKPTSQFRRVCWFLLEEWYQRRIDVPDLKTGNYVRLLNPEKYITGKETDSPRHRIRCNWLGNRRFCPIVRRSELLSDCLGMGLPDKVEKIVSEIPPIILARASVFLHKKETRSSYDIEREKPSRSRIENVIDLLKTSDSVGVLNEQTLVALNRRIVDERYAAESFRDVQNYIGTSQGLDREVVHFIPPRPEAIPELMAGFEACAASILSGKVDPIIAASVISYSFVFLHPFEDGNGRTHRFLIHHVLSKLGLTPKGFVLPVSATMLNHPADYGASLEDFSIPLMECTEYMLDDEGRCSVLNLTQEYFRFPDLTQQCCWLFEFIRRTLEEELLSEIEFLECYDRAKTEISKIVDMPNQRLDLFIRLVRQNGGTLATRRRDSFRELTDDEVASLSSVVRESFPTDDD